MYNQNNQYGQVPLQHCGTMNNSVPIMQPQMPSPIPPMQPQMPAAMPPMQPQMSCGAPQQYPPQMPGGNGLGSIQLIAQGPGIDSREYESITRSALEAMSNNMLQGPLSQKVVQLIKKMIGGEWFVFACPIGYNAYDFALSVVTGNDFLSFYAGNMHFQVCRLRA